MKIIFLAVGFITFFTIHLCLRIGPNAKPIDKLEGNASHLLTKNCNGGGAKQSKPCSANPTTYCIRNNQTEPTLNQLTNDQTADNKIEDNQTTDSRIIDDQDVDSQTIDDQDYDSQTTDSQTEDNQITDSQSIDCPTTDSEIIDNQIEDNETTDSFIMDDTTDSYITNSYITDNRTEDNQTTYSPTVEEIVTTEVNKIINHEPVNKEAMDNHIGNQVPALEKIDSESSLITNPKQAPMEYPMFHLAPPPGTMQIQLTQIPDKPNSLPNLSVLTNIINDDMPCSIYSNVNILDYETKMYKASIKLPCAMPTPTPKNSLTNAEFNNNLKINSEGSNQKEETILNAKNTIIPSFNFGQKNNVSYPISYMPLEDSDINASVIPLSDEESEKNEEKRETIENIYNNVQSQSEVQETYKSPTTYSSSSDEIPSIFIPSRVVSFQPKPPIELQQPTRVPETKDFTYCCKCEGFNFDNCSFDLRINKLNPCCRCINFKFSYCHSPDEPILAPRRRYGFKGYYFPIL